MEWEPRCPRGTKCAQNSPRIVHRDNFCANIWKNDPAVREASLKMLEMQNKAVDAAMQPFISEGSENGSGRGPSRAVAKRRSVKTLHERQASRMRDVIASPGAAQSKLQSLLSSVPSIQIEEKLDDGSAPSSRSLSRSRRVSSARSTTSTTSSSSGGFGGGSGGGGGLGVEEGAGSSRRRLGMKTASALQMRMAALRSKISKGKNREDKVAASPPAEHQVPSSSAAPSVNSRSSSTSSMRSLASHKSGNSGGTPRSRAIRRTPSWLAKQAPPPPAKPPPPTMPSLEENGTVAPPPPSQPPPSSAFGERRDSTVAEEEAVQAFLKESKRRSIGGRKKTSSRSLSMTRTRSKRSLSSQMDLSIKVEAVTSLWDRLQVSTKMNWCCFDVQVRYRVLGVGGRALVGMSSSLLSFPLLSSPLLSSPVLSSPLLSSPHLFSSLFLLSLSLRPNFYSPILPSQDVGGKPILDTRGSGSDGWEGLSETFEHDRISFGILSVYNKRNSSSAYKFVLVAWIGKDVSSIKRALASLYKKSVENILSASGGSISMSMVLTADEDLARDAMEEKLVGYFGDGFAF